MAQWIYSLDGKIIIRYLPITYLYNTNIDNDYMLYIYRNLFVKLCYENNKKIIEWFYSIYEGIDIDDIFHIDEYGLASLNDKSVLLEINNDTSKWLIKKRLIKKHMESI